MTTGIYCIENLLDGKRYIGQSKDIEKRLRDHELSLLGSYCKNRHLQSSFRKYGRDSFSFYTLEACQYESLDEKEIWYISFYRTTKDEFGYNVEEGGNKNKTISRETRERMGDARRGRKTPPEVVAKIVESRKWYKHSEETKRKISESNKGRKVSEEVKAKLSLLLKGRIISQETRNKMSSSRMGRFVGELTRERISKSKKGKVVPEASRKNMSLAHIGYKPTKEALENMSDAMSKRNWGNFVSPDRIVYKDVINLGRFCREHQLQYSSMVKIATGGEGRKQHKGWKVSK